MKTATSTTPGDEETYAPVDKWPKSTGFLPVTAGSNPAGSTLTFKKQLAHLGTLVLIAWGQSVEPSCHRDGHGG